MDQRTLLVEIISLLKDAREKKQSKLYLKMLPQEACTFKFKKKTRFEFFKTKSLFSKSVQHIKHRM